MPLPTVSSGDSGHVAYHNLIHALMPTGESVTVYTKAGTPVDGDFTSTPTNGTIAINTSTDRVWYRKAGTWTELTAAASTPTSVDQPSAGAAGDDVVKSKLTADTQYRFIHNADGKLEWGSGTAAVDTNFYRLAANNLATDDALTITGGIECLANNYAYANATGQMKMGLIGGSYSGLEFGSGSPDTNLYRPVANTLKTDDIFIAGVNESLKVEATDPADGETALLVRRNVGGAFSAQRVSMGVTDSGGAGFKVLRVPN